MDANAGYWQIPMAPEDVHKTSFITHQGLFEYTRMPFGLTGAPGTYQKMMDEILHDEINGPEPCVTQYLDDTCTYTKSWPEHVAALRRILVKLISINLKLAPKECVFGTNSAEHLGHIIRKNQLLPDPKKIEAVQNWPAPETVTEVRAFIGLAGYYRHFIKSPSASSAYEEGRPLYVGTRSKRCFSRDQISALQRTSSDST